MKYPTNPICIYKECQRKELLRSLAGYPYCLWHFITTVDYMSKWYWITWHLWRKNKKRDL